MRSCHIIHHKLCGRSLKVDHVENYRLPKHLAEKEERGAGELTNIVAGHAHQEQELASQFSLNQGQDLFAPVEAAVAPNEQPEKDENRGGKRKRNDEKRQKRTEKVQRKRERAEKRMHREEKRRGRRARGMKDNDADDRS